MARFALEDQLFQIAHALGVKNAVQVIAFVLHDAGVKALGNAFDDVPLMVDAAITDMGARST